MVCSGCQQTEANDDVKLSCMTCEENFNQLFEHSTLIMQINFHAVFVQLYLLVQTAEVLYLKYSSVKCLFPLNRCFHSKLEYEYNIKNADSCLKLVFSCKLWLGNLTSFKHHIYVQVQYSHSVGVTHQT